MDTYTFAVFPVDSDDAFESFLLEVPTFDSNINLAARRAYFAVMEVMWKCGFDIEDFNVCVWEDNKPGELVGPKGVNNG